VKPPPFQYHNPKTLQQALRNLAELDNSRLIAGGQSLMPMLNMRLATPDHLIDLAGIEGLAYIEEKGDQIAIGAMTSQRAIEYSELVKRRLPLLSEAILSVGHRQTRNRGTIGGSLCHLDPSAEIPLVAIAFDAAVEVSGSSGARAVPMVDFALDFMTPAIAPDEIVTEIRFQPWPQGHGAAFIEFARRKGDFAIVAVAAMLMPGSDGKIARASLSIGGVGPVPLRVKDAEAILTGSAPDHAVFERAAAACAAIEPLTDPHAPPWYRRKVATALARRTLDAAWKRVGSVA
jgi:aerobic carbon-monoxide dehydrogenase medium subunit